MVHEHLSFAETGYFSGMMKDYLAQAEGLKPFYHRFPTWENLHAQAGEKGKTFSSSQRGQLVAAVERQYKSNGITPPGFIQDLLDEKTFTVTTGHQLCLFTGPLYFIYKIVTAINLAKGIQQRYPNLRVIPVYWMATEDHDFEEVNHIFLNDQKIHWTEDKGGAVGQLPTAGIDQALERLSKLLPNSSAAKELLHLFKKAYAQPNLALATRYLVNELFAEEELLVVDGDDQALKSAMKGPFTADLMDHLHHDLVTVANQKLEAQYHTQAMVRPINLFYLEEGSRSRIEKTDNFFRVVDRPHVFSESELLQELEQHPERFSPNVILRPLYQESILPNLCYIGGGGELAYWFQLKPIFEAHQVPFPILLLRNSVLWIPQEAARWMEKEQLTVPEAFIKHDALIKQKVLAHAPLDGEFKEQEEQLHALFKKWEEIAQQTDTSMMGAVHAQRAKQLKGLENLKKKFIRAEKRRQSDRTDRLGRFKALCFPKDQLQERYSNMAEYYARYGDKWLKTLLAELDPLSLDFSVFIEDKPL